MVEAIAYAALLPVLLARRPVQTLLGALAPARRAYLVILVAALVGGHLVDRSAATYPFVSWAMYAAPVPAPATFYEYTVIRRSGREEPLPVARVFPGLSTRLVRRLRALADELVRTPDGPSRSARLAEYGRLLGAIARRHDTPDGLDPIDAVQVWHTTVAAGARAPRAVTRQRLWLVTVVPAA
jgi:hypothetical protein